MKKLILIFIIIGIYSLCQAKPWQDYTEFTSPADGDHFLINDISETGPPDNNAEGTLKRLAWLYVQPRDSDLTAIAALTTATYGWALLAVATELAFQQLVNLEIGVDVQAYHINLDAIADAEAGVADPAITMYDSSAAAGTADIFGTSTGAYVIIMSLWVDVAGVPTEYLQIDGVSETVDVLKPLTAPSIDAGIEYSYHTSDYSIQASEPDVCRKFYAAYGFSGNFTFTLPETTICGSGSSKEFYFSDYDITATDDLRIDPYGGTNDIFFEGASCGAGVALICTSDAEHNVVHVISGIDGKMVVMDYNGICDCE